MLIVWSSQPRVRVVEYDPYAYEVHEDPYPVYRALRDEAPVYRNESLGFWALSRYTDVLAAFKDIGTFSNRHGVSVDRDVFHENASATMSFLAMDPPRHTRMRALVSRGFTPRRVSELEPRIRAIAREHLDACAGRGRCDFIADFAGKLPMDVISELLGVPASDRPTLRSWADTVVHRDEGVRACRRSGCAGGACACSTTSTRMLADSRRRPARRPDRRAPRRRDRRRPALGPRDHRLPVPDDRRRKRDDDEAAGQRHLLAVAKSGRAREGAARSGADPPLGRGDAALRQLDPGAGAARGARRRAPRREASRRRQGRPARRLGEPRRARLPGARSLRRASQHPKSLAFGQGTHFCLGASLARLEGRVALEEVERRLPEWEVEPSGSVRVHSVNVRGFAALPIRFAA